MFGRMLSKFGNVYLIIATIVYYAACGYTDFRARISDARYDTQLKKVHITDWD